MLREHARFSERLYSRKQCLAFLGSRFRPMMKVPSRLPDVQVMRLQRQSVAIRGNQWQSVAISERQVMRPQRH